jgi:hypothetical protein
MINPESQIFSHHLPKRGRAWKTATIVLSAVLLVSLLLNVEYFKQRKRMEEVFDGFINRMYDALKDAERMVATITGEDSWQEHVTDQELLSLGYALNRVHFTMQEGAYHLGVHAGGGSINIFGFIAQSIMFGGSSGTMIIPQMIGKPALSDEDARFVEGLGAMLADLLKEMEIGLQENGRIALSRQVYSDIMSNYTFNSGLYPLWERSYRKGQSGE